jgi:hypothetical protein
VWSCSGFIAKFFEMIRFGYASIIRVKVDAPTVKPRFSKKKFSLFLSFVNSRYGTPDELKALIDEAHRLGISVLLDLIHSHASKNVSDGLNQFDGTNGCFFHDNSRGYHNLWDSRCFNYTEYVEIQYIPLICEQIELGLF